jgi:adenylate kinase
MILQFMRESRSKPGARGLTLDGFPRNITQAEKLDQELPHVGQKIDHVISLEVPRELLLERLSGRWVCRAHGHVYNTVTHPPKRPGICDIDGSELYQRSDDAPEKIARRLDIFFGETIKLLPYYERQGKLTHIDGSQPANAVTQAALAALGAKRRKFFPW